MREPPEQRIELRPPARVAMARHARAQRHEASWHWLPESLGCLDSSAEQLRRRTILAPCDLPGRKLHVQRPSRGRTPPREGARHVTMHQSHDNSPVLAATSDVDQRSSWLVDRTRCESKAESGPSRVGA